MAFFCWWLVLIAYTSLIFWTAFLPASDLPSFIARFDKALHAGEYALLYAVAVCAFYGSTLRVRRPPVAFQAFLYSLFVGGLTELLQRVLPGRSASIGDFLADGFGAGLMLLVLFMLKRRLPAVLF